MPHERFPDRMIRFGSPGDADPDTMRRAATAVVTLSAAGVGFVAAALSFLSFDITRTVFVLVTVCGIACFPLIALCRRGHVDAAVYGFVGILTIVTVGSPASTQDLGVTPLVVAPIAMLLVPILPRRTMWVAPAWALVAIAGMWLVTNDGSTSQWPREAWVVLSAIVAGAGVVIMAFAARLVLWAWDRQSILERTLLRRRDSADRLQVEAHTDPLTTLGNRRSFEALPPVTDGAVVVLDIDDFKGVNDRFGHEAGDFVLRDLAESMRSESRGNDALFRLGGDEFVVVLADADIDDAQGWVVRLGLRISHSDADLPPYSVTAGISACDGSPRDALMAADEALVGAKRSGVPTAIAVDGERP